MNMRRFGCATAASSRATNILAAARYFDGFGCRRRGTADIIALVASCGQTAAIGGVPPFHRPSHLSYSTHNNPTTRRRFSSSSSPSSSSSSAARPSFRWLDLRGVGLSMLERLSVEEALLRHTRDNWIVVGTHHVWPPKYLRAAMDNKNESTTANNKLSLQNLPDYMISNKKLAINPNCMVVMGIGGKPESLLHQENVRDDRILVVKRFSGGGTVVLDENSVWTTLIGRTPTTTHTKDDHDSAVSTVDIDPYPRSIMDWSAESVFGPAFDKLTAKITASTSLDDVSDGGSSTSQTKPSTKTMKTLVLGNKACCGLDHSSKNSFMSITKTTNGNGTNAKQQHDIPKFYLRENDYVLGKDQKMGGNAQSITKDGWLHHTSFLWDFDVQNMERYLKLPEKRPEYRASRSHGDFLTALAPIFEDANNPGTSYHPFVDSLHEACKDSFDLRQVSWSDVHQNILQEQLGGMEAWFEKNRTKIV